MRSSFWLLKW